MGGDWWRDGVKPVDSWGIIGLRMHFGYARLVDGNEIRIIIVNEYTFYYCALTKSTAY